MKLFSWIQDLKSPNENEDSEPPPLSPELNSRLAELEEMLVRDAMIPRALVIALDAQVQLHRVRRLKSAKVAHFPVYKGDLDQIVGWISKQKVMELLNESSEDIDLEHYAQPVAEVNENTSVADLADLFLKSASPFLIVKSDAGTTTGVMPLAEFVEIIFGIELSPVSGPVSEAPRLLRSHEL
ncbi:MAG: hypothetical protein AB7G93_17570 [Bdellovibrionales bacterium]